MKFLSAVSASRLAVIAAVVLPFAAVNLHAQEKSTVVYVSGNQLVVNNAVNGLDYGYTLGSGDSLKTDAGSVAASGLKVGTVITGGLKGSGKVVDDASVVKATVVSVAPPNEVVVKIGGENKKVSVAGGVATGMKAGDTVDLTLVSVRTEGDNRPMSSVKAPAMAGTLAFFQEPNMEEPDSATNLPTYGLIGGLLLVAGFVVRRFRTA
jgi:hypothetical protein